MRDVHTTSIGCFDSAEDTFDVLTQNSMLKVLEQPLLYILNNCRKADTDFSFRAGLAKLFDLRAEFTTP